MTLFGVALASVLAAFGVSQQLQNPSNAVQQTVVTSTTRIVVVLIPGFPLESILIGILVGVIALHVLRRMKRR